MLPSPHMETHDPRRVFFVVNGRAGRCEIDAIRRQLEVVLVEAPFEWDCFFRTRKGQSRTEATQQALDDGYDTIVAVGGDGTVSKVGNGMAMWEGERDASPVLGIVPTGTANLLARSLNVPLDVEDALALLSEPCPLRHLDGMRMTDRTVFSHVSLGTYSRITKQESDTQKEWLGKGAYVWKLFQEVRREQDWTFDLTIDGTQESVKASLVMIANIAATGLGDMQWGDHIDPCDGVLDVCLITASGLRDYGQLVWQALRGETEASDAISYRQVTNRLTISASDDDLPVRADGKLRGAGSVTIDVVPGAITVIAPAQ